MNQFKTQHQSFRHRGFQEVLADGSKGELVMIFGNEEEPKKEGVTYQKIWDHDVIQEIRVRDHVAP